VEAPAIVSRNREPRGIVVAWLDNLIVIRRLRAESVGVCAPP
jgi:hypothetical protein